MAYDKYEDLMNRSIDGLLSAQEQAELDRYLQDHPVAGKKFKMVQNADKVLSQTLTAEPPPDLKQEIMRAIRVPHRSSAKKIRFWANFSNILRSHSIRRYGYAFSAGLVCGIIILAMSSDMSQQYQSPDPSQVSGALVTLQSADEVKVLDSKNFEVGACQGSIETRAFENYVLLDININSGNLVNIEIIFDSADLSYAGFWQPDHFRGGFDIDDNHLTLSQQGIGRHTLLFLNQLSAESNLVFEIESGDSSLREVLSSGTTEK